MIEETLDRVTEMFESVSVIRSDGTMGPVRYPPEALKEIVVNAVVHRDYNISDDILVTVLNNRVEVKSPGLLPGHMTLENLLKERFSRNPTIVRLLNKYPDPPNKDIGEGLRTAFDKMAEARLQAPRFAIDGGYFIAVLPHVPLARPQEIVLEYLEAHDEVTNSIGRSLTGITSENAMKDVFYSLRDAGKIERVPGKAGSKSAWRNLALAIEPHGGQDVDGGFNSASVTEEAPHPADTANSRRFPRRTRRRHERVGRSPARNGPCPCGSGLKYKRCHALEQFPASGTSVQDTEQLQDGALRS